MRALRLAVTGFAVLALAVAAGAQDKEDKEAKKDKKDKKPAVTVTKENLEGTWTAAGAKGKGGLTVQISRGGKATIIVPSGKAKGKVPQVEKTMWSYEISGDTVTLTRKGKGKEESETRKYTITALTKTTMTVKDEKGQVTEFRKRGERKSE